jgi:uncharacterized DUF497 family protein
VSLGARESLWKTPHQDTIVYTSPGVLGAVAVVALEFEWDAKKNEANVGKHGIDFAEALKVFSDPGAIVFEGKHRPNEARHLIVGRMSDVLIAVVYTMRQGCIRIISARRARTSERKRYGQ